MSVNTDHGTGGRMDLAEHVKSWGKFKRLVVWSLVIVFFIMLFLVIFRTHN